MILVSASHDRVGFTPMHHPMIMVSSADFGGYHQGSDLDTEEP